MFKKYLNSMKKIKHKLFWIYLSRVSSSRWFKSQAMYSRAASVTLGHHETSRDLNFRKFSAISSIPSSVTLEHPDNDRTVKFGKVWTKKWKIDYKNFRNYENTLKTF